jgi:hypothetical protein
MHALLARLGFDWLTLDMEHQPINWREAAALFGAIADGCVSLVRVTLSGLAESFQAAETHPSIKERIGSRGKLCGAARFTGHAACQGPGTA